MALAAPPARPEPSPPTGPTPPLRRRLAALVYEGLLLFGVTMAAGFAYALIFGQRHGLEGRLGLQAVLVLVLGAYFIGFWRHGGQTLAMQTWRLRLVGRDGGAPPLGRALLRFLLSWIWVLPPLALGQALGWSGSGTTSAALLGWVLVYGGLSRLLPGRQFAHDLLAGTRLVDTRETGARG